LGEAAIEELKLVNEELILANKTIIDSREIINNLKLRNSISDEVIRYEKEKYNLLERYSNNLQDDLRKQKTTNKWITIGSGSLIVLLITGIIIK
jgi:hypothetical protein